MACRLSMVEAVKLGLVPEKKRSKYLSVKVVIDGITFDSRREAQVC